MSGSLSAGVAERLLAAKLGFIDGDALRARGDGPRSIHAAISRDHAVETALKAVVSHRGPGSNAHTSFAKLVKMTSPVVPAAIAFAAHRDVRNAAQHDGLVPTPSQLANMSSAALECLRQCVAACDGSYDSLTMEPFVANPTTRQVLKRARSHVDSNPPGALAQAQVALRWVRHMAKFVVAEARGVSTWESFDPLYGDRGSHALSLDDEGDMATVTTMLLDGLVSVGLGFDLHEEVEISRLLTAQRPAARADAELVIEYAARHAYRLERLLPRTCELSPDASGPTAPGAEYMTIVVDPRQYDGSLDPDPGRDPD